jgi:hypothetical protein
MNPVRSMVAYPKRPLPDSGSIGKANIAVQVNPTIHVTVPPPPPPPPLPPLPPLPQGLGGYGGGYGYGYGAFGAGFGNGFYNGFNPGYLNYLPPVGCYGLGYNPVSCGAYGYSGYDSCSLPPPPPPPPPMAMAMACPPCPPCFSPPPPVSVMGPYCSL